MHERALSLDTITSPEGCGDNNDGSPYRSLRNAVATLSNLSGLNTTWKPIAHVKTAMKHKLVVNSVVNPLMALLGCRNSDLLESAKVRKIIKCVCAGACLCHAGTS